MHWQTWPLFVTVAAGVTTAAPSKTSWPLRQGMLRQIRVAVPAGHNGRTGLRVVYQGTEIIPWNLNSWLTGSNETFIIPWDDEIMATGMSVWAYNIDSTAHTFRLYAEILPTVGAAGVSGISGLFTTPTRRRRHREIATIGVRPGLRA